MNDAAREVILLVEDDPNDVLLIRRAFRKAGLTQELQIAADGEEAVAYLAGEGGYRDRARYPLPRVMLLDLKLPRRSGLEVLQWLSTRPEAKRLPVVVLTSSRENADIRRAYDLGANSYLVKPVAFDALHEMMSTIRTYWLQWNQQVPA